VVFAGGDGLLLLMQPASIDTAITKLDNVFIANSIGFLC
jgi:hypothetical protein